MRASLADQGGPGGPAQQVLLAIGVGSNLPSPAGSPRETLVALRPRLAALLHSWAGAACRLAWSPLFSTVPVGGPPAQPDYLNAAVVAAVPGPPAAGRALELLRGLQELELAYGRQRLERWGARSLDLDLLWWGNFSCALPALELPHPRWQQRSFVVEPLRAIAACRSGGSALPAATVDRLQRALAELPRFPPLAPLPAQSGWPE